MQITAKDKIIVYRIISTSHPKKVNTDIEINLNRSSVEQNRSFGYRILRHV